MNLKKLFNPKSIAIIGASQEEGKVGNVIAKNILNLGYKGEVYFVNPKYDKVFEKKCYKKLKDIDAQIDLAVFAIPAKFVANEIKKNAKKIKNHIVISAGFSETDEEGKKLEEYLLQIAQKNKINILGPNCLGLIVPKIKMNASFAGGMPERGNISFITQSGALAVALMDKAKKEKMGFSNLVSIGNKMQITEAEILEYLIKDKNTKVIGMYLEGIKHGNDFMRIAQEISRVKPVVILKAGKSEKTQHAISSHTGALAGNDDIISVILKKAGLMRANNLEEFFNVLNLISNYEKVSSKKTVIVTNAGGVGVLAADSFLNKNIQLFDFNESMKKKLKNFLPKEASVENPIDLLGDAKTERYRNILKTVLKIDEVGSVICLLTPQDQTPVLEIAKEIIKFKKKTKKLIATVFLGGEKVEEAIAEIKNNKICNFNFPDSAVDAIDKYYSWENFGKIKIKKEAQVINKKRRSVVLQIIKKAKSENRSALYFSESARIMEMYQVNTVKYEEIFPDKKFDGCKLKFPVVLKVDSDKVLHKTDKQGLVLNIEDNDDLQKELAGMKINFHRSRFIVQSMASRGTEIIIGIKRDATFGPIVLYGLGGIYTEIFKIVEQLAPPLSLGQIEKSLLEGKLRFLFDEFRGQKKYNLEELARIILGISVMSLEIPEICEFDINPLIIYNDRKNKSVALDVKIMI